MKQKILILITFFLLIPFIIIIFGIFNKIDNLLNKKFKKEINEKKEFVVNFLKYQNLNFKNYLKELSNSKELIKIFNEATIYQNEDTAKNDLIDFIKNTEFKYIELYNLNKKFIISNEKSIIIPKKFFKNKPTIITIQEDNDFYLTGISPLFIGTVERNIYGYVVIIKHLNDLYLTKLGNIFKILSLKISNFKLPESNFIINLGETVTGKNIILNGIVKDYFYKNVSRQNKTILIYLIISLLLFCVVTIIIITNNILKPINYLNTTIENMTLDKLSLINYKKNDELSEIFEKLNQFILKIKNILKDIFFNLNKENNNLKSLKKEINLLDSNKNFIMQRSSIISNICEQINSHLKEVKNLNEKIIEDNNNVSDLLNNILILSEEATNTSNISNITFKEINRNSEEIKNFLTSIIDISSQINLLSVNASIEAIKSGEVGSGFSVVADEIKNLAETTKEFVENIQKLIENNYHIVKQGVEYSEKINTTLSKLDENVKKLNEHLKNFSGEIKLQKEMLEKLQTDFSEPIEIMIFIKNTLTNIENIIKNFSTNIDSIIMDNKESIEILNNYVAEEMKEDENKK